MPDCAPKRAFSRLALFREEVGTLLRQAKAKHAHVVGRGLNRTRPRTVAQGETYPKLGADSGR